MAENTPKQRKATAGSWKPGTSGNPGGRPAFLAEVRQLAQQHTPTAFKTLLEVARSKKANPSARVAAAKELLDRAVGRAPAAPEDAGLVKDALEVIIRTITDGDKTAE